MLFKTLLLAFMAVAAGSPVADTTASADVVAEKPCFLGGMQVDASNCVSPPPPVPGPPPPFKPPHMPPPPPGIPLAQQAVSNPYVIGGAGLAIVGIGAYVVMSRAGGVAMS